jgi:hypothetical protein
MLLTTWLSAIPDPRRPQGRVYGLEHILLFSILAVLSNATSYRKIERFIQARLPRLNALCGLRWKRAPAHTAIRYTLQGLNPADLEAAFRHHAITLEGQRPGGACVAVDGKTLRGSMDRFADQRAVQLLSALSTDSTLVLGHLLINAAATDPRHEIPAAQQLIQELSLSGRVFTLDAQHAQKNG